MEPSLNRQTKTDDYISSLAEVIKIALR